MALRISFCIALLLSIASSAVAQWQQMATNLFLSREGKPQGGVLLERAGLIWAAVDDIYVSLDRGTTWTRRSAPLTTGEIIKDLDFYDDQLGVAVTQRDDDDYVYKTTDQGLTWTPVFRFPAEFLSVSFGGSPNTIILLGSDNFLSTNGGTNWEGLDLPPYSTDIKWLGGQNLVLFSPGVLSTSRLRVSNDGGRTWTPKAGTFDTDCYSLEQDSSGNFYIVNEEYLYNEDGLAEILYSSDQGDSWVSTISLPLPATQPYPEFTGSLAAGDCALFAQTGKDGVVRSVDGARTWRSIGGPTAWVDARTIVALSDDTIIVIDSFGSIWRTINSGGIPFTSGPHANAVVLSGDRFFGLDTIYVCAATASVQTLRIYTPACSRISVSSINIEGNSADNYRYQLLGSNEIEISFDPVRGSSEPSQLRITYDDGSSSIVRLEGFAIGPPALQAWLESVQMDTLGGTACLPMTLATTSSLPIRVRFRYDEGLAPDVALGESGARLPISILAPGIGEFELGPSGATTQVSICFSNVTADPAFVYRVRLVQLESVHPDERCRSLATIDTSGMIDLEPTCGAIVLSRYLRTGALPTMTIARSGEHVELRFDKDVQPGPVALYDLAGKLRSAEVEFTNPRLTRLNIRDLPAGSYFLYLRAGHYSAARRFEIMR